MLFLLRWADLREDFKEVLADLLGIIAVGLADEPDSIRQQDVTLCFLRFVFLPLFVFLICDLLRGGYLIKRVLSLPFSYICCILYCFG